MVLWVKTADVDRDRYQSTVNDLLQCVDFSKEFLLCSDLFCQDEQHFRAIRKYAVDISEACMEAACATILLTSNRHSGGRILGWSEHVQPLRGKALFWRCLWIDCNRPCLGVVADSMRRTRAAYHYADCCQKDQKR